MSLIDTVPEDEAAARSVEVSISAGVGEIWLNRPERLNAINRQLVVELHASLLECIQSPDVAVIVLRGRGRAFCAGDDLKDMQVEFRQAGQLTDTVMLLQDVSRQIMFCAKPVIAAVHGWAVGGGLEWVLNCDLALFADDANAFFPEARLGLCATGGATALLPSLVGPARASELLLLGRKFDAQDAVRLGIASAVCPAAELDRWLGEWTAAVTGLDPRATAGLKRCLREPGRDAVERALAAEAGLLLELATQMAISGEFPPE